MARTCAAPLEEVEECLVRKVSLRPSTITNLMIGHWSPLKGASCLVPPPPPYPHSLALSTPLVGGERTIHPPALPLGILACRGTHPDCSGSPRELSTEGDYHEVKLNVMGEPHIHERISPQVLPDELYTPLKWGRAYDGPAEVAYPLPQEYTLKGTHKTLEEISVRALTKAFLAMKKTKAQKSTLR